MQSLLKTIPATDHVCRIVVVEDSETQAFRLRLILEEQGWAVHVAGSAEDALAILGEPLPDLDHRRL